MAYGIPALEQHKSHPIISYGVFQQSFSTLAGTGLIISSAANISSGTTA